MITTTLREKIDAMHQFRDHYPQCKTCTRSYSFVGETCGWVCDGSSDYSEITEQVMAWLAPKNASLVKPDYVPLTDEKIKAIQYSDPAFMTCSCPAFARAIEQAVRGKT